jgi:hypothetical protein
VVPFTVKATKEEDKTRTINPSPLTSEYNDDNGPNKTERTKNLPVLSFLSFLFRTKKKKKLP